MKSMGLALTIFALTGTLAGLDLSGVHHVQSGAPVPTLNATAPSASMSPVASKAEQEKLEEEEEGDGELVRTFLVTPRQVAPASGEAAALRYD